MPGDAMLLLQFVQQFAGFADSQVFGHVAVKPLVYQFLWIQLATSGQTIDCLDLIEFDTATTLWLVGGRSGNALFVAVLGTSGWPPSCCRS